MSATPSAMSVHVRLGIFGLALGATLGWVGFADYGEVFKMFTFEDFRLLLTFAGAVGGGFIGFATLGKIRGNLPKYRVHRGSIIGGLLFGAGWALTGACPTIVLVQIAEGKILAVATVIGIFVGVRLYQALNARVLHIESSGCEA